MHYDLVCIMKYKSLFHLSSIIDNGIVGGAHRQHEGIAGSDGYSFKTT